MPRSLACGAVVLYPVGTIVFCAWLLYMGRSKLMLAEASSPYTRSIAFLHAPFTPMYFFFDLIDMARKLLLVGFASLVSRGSLEQLVMAVIVTLLGLVLHLQSRPYRSPVDNVLVPASHVLLLMFFIW